MLQVLLRCQCDVYTYTSHLISHIKCQENVLELKGWEKTNKLNKMRNQCYLRKPLSLQSGGHTAFVLWTWTRLSAGETLLAPVFSPSQLLVWQNKLSSSHPSSPNGVSPAGECIWQIKLVFAFCFFLLFFFSSPGSFTRTSVGELSLFLANNLLHRCWGNVPSPWEEKFGFATVLASQCWIFLWNKLWVWNA